MVYDQCKKMPEFGEHLSMTNDTIDGKPRSPVQKLKSIADAITQLTAELETTKIVAKESSQQ